MLHVAVATRAFRRYSTYTAATLAGIFTNSVFGVIYSYAYLALWAENPDAGGYDATDAVTYVWLGQALLMTVAAVGRRHDRRPGRADPDRRRRDRPVPTGRAARLVPRRRPGPGGVPPAHPRGWRPRSSASCSSTSGCRPSPVAAVAFLVSLPLAVTVSFALRFLVASHGVLAAGPSGPGC